MNKRDDLTEQETEQMDATPGETPEEAHRVGEYDAVMAKLDGMTEMISGMVEKVAAISDKMGAFSSMAVDAGAEVVDDPTDDDPSEPDIIEVPDVTELDLDM